MKTYSFFKSFFLATGLLLACLFLGGLSCKKFAPPATSGDQPFKERIQRETQGDVTVWIGIPSPEETKQIFQTDLYSQDIQPVWIQIQNKSKGPATLLLASIDDRYYSPNEVAYKTTRSYSAQDQIKRERFFEGIVLNPYVGAGETHTGYIFTRVDEGSKYIAADVLTKKNVRRFTYMIKVPGLNIDFYKVDFDKLYKPEEIKEVSLKELRRNLEEFPCCTFSKKGELIGDPVNLVVIAEGKEALSAFIRSGWRETERQKGQTLKTLDAYLNKRPYDYAPMSTLWLYKRGQDEGFQKPRESPHSRNHFRLWLTPWRYQGQEVWIGAISRDIGLRYTVKSPYLFTTHKIDSEVDETREYLLQDLLEVKAIRKFGYVKGVGEVPITHPKLNPMGDHWYSDGLRLVLFLSKKPVNYDDVEILNWEPPPQLEAGSI